MQSYLFFPIVLSTVRLSTALYSSSLLNFADKILSLGLSGLSDGSDNFEATSSTGVKTFASYGIYKGKSALAVKPIAPSYSSIKDGSARTISRPGAMIFEAAQASGAREYDWKNKIAFALGVTECGQLLYGLNVNEGSEFIHDPNIGTAQAGQMLKKMKLLPMQDGKGLFISFQVTEKAAASTSISVPVSWAEVQVIKALIEFCVPRFLGFDTVWQSNNES